MVLHGKVHNGVVVLEGSVKVPDGTEVSVVVRLPPTRNEAALAAERDVQKAALAELLALPDENPGDTFSGADHDRVLYGEPE